MDLCVPQQLPRASMMLDITSCSVEAFISTVCPRSTARRGHGATRSGTGPACPTYEALNCTNNVFAFGEEVAGRAPAETRCQSL
jgi:hypothetical protein